MPKYYLALLLWITVFTLSAQDTKRYSSPIFKTIVQRTETYAIKGKDTLRLDLYLPKDDVLERRPTVLFVHGGGFSGGVRDDSLSKAFAFQLAQRGFVVASMSYRLTMKGQSFSCDQARANKIRTFQLVVEDVRSAVNFLLDRDKALGIDKEKIVLAGSSAGAEAVLHTVYWPNSRLRESAPKLPRNFSYAGVISFAGAIVETTGITKTSAVPSAFFHGTCDDLVPYGTASHHYCEEGSPGYMTLHGSYALASHFQSLGASYLLVSHCGGGHGWASYPMRAYVPMIATFLKEQVIEGQRQQLHYLYSEYSSCEKVKGLPFCKD